MSSADIRRVFKWKIDDQMVTKMVSDALRCEYKNNGPAVKKIHLETGINAHSVYKWFEAENVPKSAHLLLLAAHYPLVLRGILELIGCADVWELCLEEKIPERMRQNSSSGEVRESIYRDKFVPINILLDLEKAVQMNQRQLWFLGELHRGRKLKAEDIAKRWKVAEKTARRDIAALLESGMIHFIGARKNGYYMVV